MIVVGTLMGKVTSRAEFESMVSWCGGSIRPQLCQHSEDQWGSDCDAELLKSCHDLSAA